MSEARFTLQSPIHPDARGRARPLLGRALVDAGKITNTQLVQALAQQETVAAPLGKSLSRTGC
ncbi:hypothetical protein [Aestuariivita boseongensis]|uniref:hypothetical protein n=1 Tax=Aestuariivita boseongensis TaxID=1470562 RepID=UPI00068091E1|nr:hypothetical protein [Aestuariivita boseongensis]